MPGAAEHEGIHVAWFGFPIVTRQESVESQTHLFALWIGRS